MPRRRKANTAPVPGKMPSQRQLKVGEELRHVIAGILMRESFHDPDLDGVAITVSEVSVAADLANAAVFIIPPSGADTETTLNALQNLAPAIQRLVAGRVSFKRTPRLQFIADTAFANAERIESLIARNAGNAGNARNAGNTRK